MSKTNILLELRFMAQTSIHKYIGAVQGLTGDMDGACAFFMPINVSAPPPVGKRVITLITEIDMETKTKTISDGAAILMQHGRLTRFFLTLLVLLMTAATAWAAQPDKYLDACTGGAGFIHLEGWAYDPDAPSTSIDVNVYVYTDAGCTNQYGSIAINANVSRPDVNQAKGITGYHGFNTDIPMHFTGNYWVKVFAIDTGGDGNPQIGSTTAVTVTPSFAGQRPVSHLDACTGGGELIHIQGWAYDPDASSQSINVHVYFYTDAGCTNQYGGIYVTKANVSRPDVNQAKGITGNHGFSADIPIAAGKYWVKLFAIDTNGDGNPQIGATTAVTVTGPVTITIGEPQFSTCYYPFVMNKNYSLVQQIYTAEEIGMEGTITSIAFNYAGSAAFSMSGVQVYLKHTDKNKFDSQTDMVLVGAEDKVFEGTFSATGAGWATIKFDTPFEYDGNSNLLVCCFDPTSGSFGTDYKFYCYFSNDDYKCHQAYSDNIVPSLEVNNVSTSVRVTGRSMIRFNINPGTFSKPDNLTLSSCTEEEATLTWTAPETDNTITGYGYQFKKASDADWSEEVTTTGTSGTISGLTADTDYDFRVRTIYGSIKSSYQIFHFTTSTALPYEMGFEDGYGRWTMVDCNVKFQETLDQIFGTGRRSQAARSGNVGFQFSSGDGVTNPQYLISPRFAGNVAIRLSFYIRVATDIPETIYVGYSTTTNDKDAFAFDDAITYNSSNWAKIEHIFPANARYFAIKFTSNEYRMYIDDFSFEESSTYAKPTSIIYTNLSETEATLEWNSPVGTTGFAYQYKKTSDAAWSAVAALNTNTVTLSGLTPNTSYNFRVKALYGNNASNYTPATFQTEANVVDLPYTDGFENGMGGWRIMDCEGLTRIIEMDNPHGGTYAFRFYNSDHDQYLHSPHFAGGVPMKVSFYYTNYENYHAAFLVGYTSSKTDNITWENNAVIASGGAWKLYETTVPAEAQYVVICCLKEGNKLFLDDFSFTGPIVLADNADNTAVISDAASLGEPCNIRLGGRTLYRDGDWNTLTVPFAVSSFDGTPLEGATVKTLSSTAFSNGTLTLNFEDATEIEAGKPYIVKWDDGVNVTIGSAAEWDAFAESVNGGKSFAGKTVMLTSDISGVATMAGTAEHPFRGTFEGAGHTMDMGISDGGDGAAPFHYISGATIRNVRTTGTVSGGNHSAGLVGIAQGGTNSIRDCYVDATVSTSGSYVGGILGNGTTSTTTISNCLFGGSIAASNMGILYGWGEAGGTHTVENCVAYGNYALGGSIDLLLGNGSKTVTNCWKNTNYGSQGENTVVIYMGSGEHPLVTGYLGSQWTYDNGFVLSPTVSVVDENIVNPVFLGVTVDATPSPVTTAWADFVGTYEPMSFSDADKSILFLGTANTLYYPVSGAYIGAQRAFFRLKGLTAGDLPNNARAFVLNFGEGDHTTGIIEIAKDDRESGSSNSATGWYTLDGRKLSGKPTQKGIYVNNGRKVVIK